MAASMKSWLIVYCFTILLTVHQLVPRAAAAPISEQALTRISAVARLGGGIMAGGSTSGLGGSGDKKPPKVLQSTGIEGRRLATFGAGGSSSPHGGSGNRIRARYIPGNKWSDFDMLGVSN